MMDVDEERLRTSDSMARGLVASTDAAAEVVATLDARHAEDGVRAEAVAEIRRRANAAGERRGVTVAAATGMEQAAVGMSVGMVHGLKRAAERVMDFLEDAVGYTANGRSAVPQSEQEPMPARNSEKQSGQ